MFDANLCHLPKGMEFFAKVHYIDDSKLKPKGVKVNDIIRCKMLSDDDDNPTVLFKLESGDIEINNNDEHCLGWIVYEGRIDGTDFIDESSRKIAMQMIESKKSDRLEECQRSEPEQR